MNPGNNPFVIVVGAGGVGKTTLAAAMGMASAGAGDNTLVMTFDPSERLKDTLGVGEAARDAEAPVAAGLPGTLHASLLDARLIFDRLIARYAPDEDCHQRILTNRWYDHLSGSLAGVLEYMAVERLFEVASSGKYSRVFLDTPPARQALDFLGAPDRLVSFLDSGALRIALKPWFDTRGRLKATSRLGFIGRNVESLLDRMVGLEVLRDMAEFFQSFGPLYDGFRERALKVKELLQSKDTIFVLVSGPGSQRVTDTIFFARKLTEEGYRLGPIIVNRVHPKISDCGPVKFSTALRDGRQLLSWLGEQERRGVEELRTLLGGSHPLIEIPLLPSEPTDLQSLSELGELYRETLDATL